jgi:hypothetical protein
MSILEDGVLGRGKLKVTNLGRFMHKIIFFVMYKIVCLLDA